MKEQAFITANRQRWQQLQQQLATDTDVAVLNDAYQALCQDLVLARSRGYSSRLCDDLNARALLLRQRLEQRPASLWPSLSQFYRQGFPQTVRRQWRYISQSAALFFLPLLGMLLTTLYDPELATLILSHSQLDDLDAMYSQAAGRIGQFRDAGSDILMLGFYIDNNVSIGFRTFIAGLLFGIGTVLLLVFNGLYIGAAAGYVTATGLGPTFWGFVAGHSAFELTAIVLSGAAGLKLGTALLFPGNLSRPDALRQQASEALLLVYGAFSLFVIAAFFEALWSSTTLATPLIKYAIGLLFWLLLALYLIGGGQREIGGEH